MKLSPYNLQKRLNNYETGWEYRKTVGSISKCEICKKETLKKICDETDADISGHTATIRHYKCINEECGVLCIDNPAFR